MFTAELLKPLQQRSDTLNASLCARQHSFRQYTFQPRIPLAPFPCGCYYLTVTFNMGVTVKIVVLTGSHVERTVNGARRAALGAIEGEIPTTTAVVTSINPEGTSKVNVKGSVCEVLHKFTVLQIS